MPGLRLKSFLPRSLYGRAAMIVFVPVLTILLVVALGFIQRHYEGVTRQMTANFVLVADHIVAEIDAADDREARASALAAALDLRVRIDDPAPEVTANDEELSWIDLSGRLAMRELRAGLPRMESIRLDNALVSVWLRAAGGPVRLDFPISRISARNPHQMLVLTLVIGLGMGTIAFLYLKNQMRPMARLAAAAEAFGRGVSVPLRPSGATEVRAAAAAFLQMRQRIERHAEQRTLLLSGVSHDLRTPLTRMRLALSLLEDEPEQRALLADVAEMEALVDRFLDFARGAAAENPEPVDLAALVAARVARGGSRVVGEVAPGPVMAALRPQLMTRAVDNLIGNALRYGGRARVALRAEGDRLVIEVEDTGPGIPEADRERATQPFVRLDPARGSRTGGGPEGQAGGGAGLGLAIVTEALRSHGGRLELDQGSTPGFGGLCARLILPRGVG